METVGRLNGTDLAAINTLNLESELRSDDLLLSLKLVEGKQARGRGMRSSLRKT